MASLYAKGGKLYLDFRWRGVRCQEATKLADAPSNRAEVRRRARVIAGEIAAGTFDYATHFPDGPKREQFAPPAEVGPPLYRDYVRGWLSDKTARVAPGWAYDLRRIVEARLIPAFGDRRVDTLTVEDVEGYVAMLVRGEAPGPVAEEVTDRRRRPRVPKKISNRRVNMILKALRQSLDRAVGRGWLSSNPARGVALLREDRPEIDPLSLEEVKAVLTKIEDDEDRRYFTVAFFTGMRPGELMGLQWDDLDWSRKSVRVRRSVSRFGTGRTKTTGSTRDVAMLPAVEGALRAQRAKSQLRGPWVFPGASGEPRHIANVRARLWNRALRRAELRARPLYQTRHTFATLMLGAGESPQWVAEMLGHSTVEMVFRRYARFIPNLTRKDGSAATKWLAGEGL